MVAFRLGSIPVKVHGWFLLMALLLGSSERQPAKLAVWVAIVFVSVLVHELGHALVGKAFGLTPRIDLHGMGGVTSWAEAKQLGYGKRIAISFAGPFAGFLFAAALILAERQGLRPGHPLGLYALGTLQAVNIAWGVFNLLPMLPLDGGNVMRSVFGALTKGRGEAAARVVSIVIAVALGGLAVLNGHWWMLYLSGMFAFSNVQALRQAGQVRIDRDLVQAIELAQKALEAQDGKRAAELLRPALTPEASLELRQLGTRLYAYALLLESDWPELLAVLDRDAKLIGEEDLARFSRTARGLGREEEAARIEAISTTGRSIEAFRA